MPVIMAPNGQAGMPMNGQMAPMGGQPGAPMGQTSNMVAYYAQMGGAGQPVMMQAPVANAGYPSLNDPSNV